MVKEVAQEEVEVKYPALVDLELVGKMQDHWDLKQQTFEDLLISFLNFGCLAFGYRDLAG